MFLSICRLALSSAASPLHRTTWPKPPPRRGLAAVFNARTKVLQRDRAALIEDSAHYDYLREEIGRHLAERLDDVPNHRFPVAVDYGCHYGLLAKHLKSRGGIKTLYQCDSSENMLHRDHKLKEEVTPEMKLVRQLIPPETFPFEAQSVDLVVSNLALHWVNDLPSVLSRVFRSLRPDGMLLASMLGGETLKELRESFVVAEQEREGGISPHVSPMTSVSDVGNLLTGAGFALTTVDTHTFAVKYADPFVLMHELQAMGEGNASLQRRLHVPRDTLLAAAAAYRALYGEADGTVPATFQVIYMIGWAPHASQPQPKKRGSAEFSLRDLASQMGKKVSTLEEIPDEEPPAAGGNKQDC